MSAITPAMRTSAEVALRGSRSRLGSSLLTKKYGDRVLSGHSGCCASAAGASSSVVNSRAVTAATTASRPPSGVRVLVPRIDASFRKTLTLGLAEDLFMPLGHRKSQERNREPNPRVRGL